MLYPTQDAAFKRADALRRAFGLWPGVVTVRTCLRHTPAHRNCRVRGYRLTFDPGLPTNAGLTMLYGGL